MAGLFSTRVPDDRAPTRLASALAKASADGRVIDLTISNPTLAGIPYPDGLLAPLADPAAIAYRPAGLGLADARDAVAETYRSRGLEMPAERIVLTSSTSEA